MSTFHAVVWMDHQEPYVLMFDREEIEAKRIHLCSHQNTKAKPVTLLPFTPRWLKPSLAHTKYW